VFNRKHKRLLSRVIPCSWLKVSVIVTNIRVPALPMERAIEVSTLLNHEKNVEYFKKGQTRNEKCFTKVGLPTKKLLFQTIIKLSTQEVFHIRVVTDRTMEINPGANAESSSTSCKLSRTLRAARVDTVCKSASGAETEDSS